MRLFLAAGLLTSLLALPVAAAPDKTKPAPDGAAEIADKLSERIDLERIEQVSFRGMIDILQEKLGYTILVDHKGILAALGEDGANRQALEERMITLPAMKRVRLETALRQVLDQVNADFYIDADHVRVTTGPLKELVIGPRRVLPELRPTAEANADEPQVEVGIQIRQTSTVTAEFKDVPLSDALQAVSRRTGRPVAVNPDAGEKAKVTVSVSMANAPFETAVSVLAEAAGLRAYRTGNAAVIITPERAKRLEGAGVSTGMLDVGSSDSRLATPDHLDRLRQDRARLEADHQALEDKVRALTAELEKLKKKQ
jgi:hypothetical protein